MQSNETSAKYVLVHWIHEEKVSIEPTESVLELDPATDLLDDPEKVYRIEYTGGKKGKGKKYDAFDGRILHTGDQKLDLKRLEKDLAAAFRAESDAGKTTTKRNETLVPSAGKQAIEKAKQLKKEQKEKREAEINAAKAMAMQILDKKKQTANPIQTDKQSKTTHTPPSLIITSAAQNNAQSPIISAKTHAPSMTSTFCTTQTNMLPPLTSPIHITQHDSLLPLNTLSDTCQKYSNTIQLSTPQYKNLNMDTLTQTPSHSTPQEKTSNHTGQIMQNTTQNQYQPFSQLQDWNYTLPYSYTPASDTFNTSNALHQANSTIYYDEPVPEYTITQPCTTETQKLKETIKQLEQQLIAAKAKCVCQHLISATPENIRFLQDLSEFATTLSSHTSTTNTMSSHTSTTHTLSSHTSTTPSASSTSGPTAAKQSKGQEAALEENSHLQVTQSNHGKIELVPGYGVYIDVRKLDACVRKAKHSPTALLRYLLMVFFSDQTLANSCASGRGRTSTRKPLDSNIVDAIKKYVQDKYSDISDTKLTSAINTKIADTRKAIKKA